MRNWYILGCYNKWIYHHNKINILWKGDTITEKSGWLNPQFFNIFISWLCWKHGWQRSGSPFSVSPVFQSIISNERRLVCCTEKGAGMALSAYTDDIQSMPRRKRKLLSMDEVKNKLHLYTICSEQYGVRKKVEKVLNNLTSNKRFCSPEGHIIVSISLTIHHYFKHAHWEFGSGVKCVFSSLFCGYMYC